MKKMKPQQKMMIAMILVSFAGVGIFSFYTIKNLQGNARIVNYSGIVRGATQKLVKEELYGKSDDPLLQRIDGILYDLEHGQGENQLEKVTDADYCALLDQVQASWNDLKGEIAKVRKGADQEKLFTQSETFFTLADRLVSAAEVYSEKQANRAKGWLISLYLILIISAGATAVYGARQKKMREALLQAEAASREKGRFLSRMSHEIRTPMNGIIGMTQIARESLPDIKKVDKCLAQIDKISKFLLELINDILDMSRIESGKIFLSNKAFHLYEMLDELRDMFGAQAAEKQIDLLISREGLSREAELVSADELHIRQILINLLSNAIKFTPEKGKISLYAESIEGEGEPIIRFTVSDTGIGMTEEFMGRMFEPFEQEESTSIAHKGTGLGLAITFRLVELMGGVLSVKSQPNEGTVFTIDLPLDQARAEAAAEREPDLDMPSQADMELLGRANILFAEDNEINAEIIEYLLKKTGARMRHAWDGEEVVAEFCREEPGTFDLILMDIQMPKLNGLEATEEIRNSGHGNAATIPIIALTANAFSEDAHAAMEKGMNGYLAKPIKSDELYGAIAAQLRKNNP
ncbi:ATP-binding protein [Anaerovorax odorimutans]|uniref:Stage 0 sporulation protein A homolog n=1 Tax=Anaerovorax odorimutans TaxID=109327 RepID=A0ABT1RKK9_9FIRM|nr:ATP-binding protein [Anaerovorax odorimutans]MCQ4635714.1 ATP-binding protein [Anaerovorax odorimutans]